MLGFLQSSGIFASTNRLRLDFSMGVLEVDVGTPQRRFTQSVTLANDCDTAPVPVPSGGFVEGHSADLVLGSRIAGYNCTPLSDCHMLFVSRAENRIYELYRSTISTSNTFSADCLVRWDTGTPYQSGRGANCISTEPSGLPLAPLVLTPEEVGAGQINHALALMLPGSVVRSGEYVRPATAAAGANGPVTAPPMGSRLRLRANYPATGLSSAVQVIVAALKKHGVILTDTGGTFLLAQDDRLSRVKWADLGIDSQTLVALTAADFEIIHSVPVFTWNPTGCTRTPINE
jgi:hypothetical protein